MKRRGGKSLNGSKEVEYVSRILVHFGARVWVKVAESGLNLGGVNESAPWSGVSKSLLSKGFSRQYKTNIHTKKTPNSESTC